MDAGRFDALTKALGHRSVRRRILGSLFGGALSRLAAGGRDPAGRPGSDQARARRKRGQCRKIKHEKERRQCSPVLLAAGDIASCASSGDEATAALLDSLGGTIAALGDIVYDSGTSQEFATCYHPSWGRHKSRTRPAVGNHEYVTPGGAGYFGYFGDAAGDPSKGYYSYELGSWHVVVLNSNCAQVGCGVGSPQEQWLRADLAAHPTACTLAYWHHPRFSSSNVHGNHPELEPLWWALYEHGADIVLSGHDHNYERFAPQDSNGALDWDRGIRQFVVGTGGRSHYGFATTQPNSEVRNGDTFGVLRLRLHWL